MLASAGDADPVENFRATGMQFVARQMLQERSVTVGAGLENGAVEILVDQKMT